MVHIGAKVLYAVDLKCFWTTASAKGSAEIFFTGKKNSLNVLLICLVFGSASVIKNC